MPQCATPKWKIQEPILGSCIAQRINQVHLKMQVTHARRSLRVLTWPRTLEKFISEPNSFKFVAELPSACSDLEVTINTAVRNYTATNPPIPAGTPHPQQDTSPITTVTEPTAAHTHSRRASQHKPWFTLIPHTRPSLKPPISKWPNSPCHHRMMPKVSMPLHLTHKIMAATKRRIEPTRTLLRTVIISRPSKPVANSSTGDSLSIRNAPSIALCIHRANLWDSKTFPITTNHSSPG